MSRPTSLRPLLALLMSRVRRSLSSGPIQSSLCPVSLINIFSSFFFFPFFCELLRGTASSGWNELILLTFFSNLFLILHLFTQPCHGTYSASLIYACINIFSFPFPFPFPSDPSLVIIGYVVRRKSGAASTETGNTVLTSLFKNNDPAVSDQEFTDYNLRPQSMYTYDVATMTSNGGQSPFSAATTITTNDKGPR